MKNMLEWVENEVNIACKRNEFEYEGSQYEYALNAYRSVYGNFISEMFLKRMIDGIPLSPITEDDFEVDHQSEEYLNDAGLLSTEKCTRYYVLHRNTRKNGEVYYSDIYRTVCVNINNQADYFTSSIANTIVNEMFPITMPYTPVNGQYRVFVEYFKSNKNKDYDYDTYKFLYLITPEGNKVDLNMFKYEKDGILYDITEEEYEERKRNKVK